MEEIWKPIPGYEGLYDVSSLGRVRNVKRGIIRVQNYDKDGYLHIGLNNKKYQYFSAHRLVASAFIPNPQNLPCIDHINGVRDDNRFVNLRWCTVADNNKFPIARERKSKALIGKRKSTQARLHNRIAQHRTIVFQYDIQGKFIKEWDALRSIERELGYGRANIKKCLEGIYSQAYGYIWSNSPLGVIPKDIHPHYKAIHQINTKGELVKVWPNIPSIAGELGVSYQAICHCVIGKTRTSQGYIWKGII